MQWLVWVKVRQNKSINSTIGTEIPKTIGSLESLKDTNKTSKDGMSLETSVIFTPLRKRCDDLKNYETEIHEDVPFTISSRNLNLDF